MSASESAAPTPLWSPAGDVRLECSEILRLLPGRRLVARTELAGRPAVVKLFLGAGAHRYRAREARGCRHLAAAGVATPALLGGLDDPAPGAVAAGLLFEHLPGAAPVSPADDLGVAAAAAALAHLHEAGCRYRDLHLDNFVTDRDGAVFVVDGDGVRATVTGRALGRRRSLEDLAVLGAQRPPLADGKLASVARAYAAARGWTLDDAELSGLAAATVRQRRRRVRRYLAKAQRDCTEFHQHRTWRQWVVAVRSCWDTAMAEFAADPEKALGEGRVLKDGNSATVVRVRLDGHSRVVKRYNVKGPWHAVRRAMKPTARFRRAWINGQRLHFLAVPTARPLALVEQRRGPWRGVAYLVMEDLGDRDLAAEVSAVGLTGQRLREVVDLFRALDAAGLSHGDTKASNFLVAPSGLALVDLDAMAERDGGHLDRRRFLANFEQVPEVRGRLHRAFEANALRVCVEAGGLNRTGVSV